MTVTAAIVVGNPKLASHTWYADDGTREQWVERWGPAVLAAAQRRGAPKNSVEGRAL